MYNKGFCDIFMVEMIIIIFSNNLNFIDIVFGTSVSRDEIASVLKSISIPSIERFLQFHKRRNFCIFLIVTKSFFRVSLLYCKKMYTLIS